jgi:hypothetical protein
MYVNTFSRPLAACSGPFPLSVTVDNISTTFSAELLQGGQRLLLSDEARDYIVSALLQQQCVTLTVGPYQATFSPTRFAKYFRYF